MLKTKTVTLETRNRGLASLTIEGSYTLRENDQKFTLLLDGTIVVGEPTSEQKAKQKDIKFDKNGIHRINIRNERDAKEVDFFRAHPLVLLPGPNGTNMNKNAIREEIILNDPEQNAKHTVSEKKLRLALLTKLSTLDNYKQYNLAFALGLNPIGKSGDEIYVSLADFAEANPENFKGIFHKSDVDYIVILRKAIALNEIKVKNGVYVYEQENVGRVYQDEALEEVIEHFKRNEPQYHALRRRVIMNDTLDLTFNSANAGMIENEEPLAAKGTPDELGNIDLNTPGGNKRGPKPGKQL